MSRLELILDSEAASHDQFPIHGELRAPAAPDFDFVIIGDRTGGAVYHMFERGLEVAAAARPDFILSVGDLVEGYWTDTAEADAEWDEIDRQLDALGIPVLLTPGNHDYGTPAMVDVWRRRKGADYYAVRYGPLLILVANSEAASDFAGVVPDSVLRWNRYNIRHPRQHSAIADRVHLGPAAAARKYPDLFDATGDYAVEAWLEPDEIAFIQAFDERLAASEDFRDPRNLISPGLSEGQLAFFQHVLREHSDAAWTLLSLHQPVWKKPDSLFGRLEAMLAGRPHTIVAGHTHILDVETRHGHHYISMGKTGGLHCFDGPGDIHHVMMVRFRSGVPTFEVIRYEEGLETLQLDQFATRNVQVGID